MNYQDSQNVKAAIDDRDEHIAELEAKVKERTKQLEDAWDCTDRVCDYCPYPPHNTRTKELEDKISDLERQVKLLKQQMHQIGGS